MDWALHVRDTLAYYEPLLDGLGRWDSACHQVSEVLRSLKLLSRGGKSSGSQRSITFSWELARNASLRAHSRHPKFQSLGVSPSYHFLRSPLGDCGIL